MMPSAHYYYQRLCILSIMATISCSTMFYGRSFVTIQPGHARPQDCISKYPKLSLRRIGKQVYLESSNRKKILLLLKGNWAPGSLFRHETFLPLLGGIKLIVTDESDEVMIRKGIKSIHRFSLDTYRDKWLAKDALWGGHTAANGMRYANSKGLDVFLDEPVRQRSMVLAIFNFQAFWESDHGIFGQFLVRIRASPNFTIEPVRRLTVREAGPRMIPRRLFSYKRSLLLFDDRRFLEIASGGGPLRSFTELPANLTPVGIVDQRWMILEKYEFGNQPLWFLDLQTKARPTPIALEWGNGQYVRDGSPIQLPSTGNQLLVGQDDIHTYVITLPKGNIIRLTNPNGFGGECLWNGLVVLKGEKSVFCYNSTTGKLLAKLPL